ncbi:alpha/beta fold hydrolase [Gorillibacterium sp. sgz5001074]|uniref:alpha/beta fold hydrolase n=1 Tax=Gorillibacterium sp. sgz5001074 TaxID=3446695 RepID=UPI003F6723B1
MKTRMKRKLKKVVKWIGIMIGILLAMVAILSIIHTACKKKEAPLLDHAYGQMVDVNGEKMCVAIAGSGEKVVVLLPGFGSTSPVLEMAPLADHLKNEYTVVTVEPFGYGLSDETKKERSIENITEELHMLLHTLGYTKYTIMAHSLSGLYSVYYTNKYPGEVEAFVGIDSSVPKQALYDEPAKSAMTSYKIQRLLYDAGMIRLLAAFDSEGIVPRIKGYEYSQEDTKTYKRLFQRGPLNDTTLQEFSMSDVNFAVARELSFPENVPVLYFLSSQNCEESEKWVELHKEVMKDKEHRQIKILQGTHYLHYDYAAEMTSQFKEWANAFKDSTN